MTVYDNIAFGLKVKKLKKQEIDEKVRTIARKVDLTDEQLAKADIGRIEMGRSIGVMNVNARVKSVYGDSCGIRYESDPNIGTKAVIVLPMVKEEAKDEREIQGFVS